MLFISPACNPNIYYRTDFYMEMRDYVEEWTIDMKVRELTEGSININRNLLQYYLDYCKATTPQDITTSSIKEFMLYKKENGCKPQYINNLLKTIKVFCNWLVEENYLKRNPAEKVQKMKLPKTKIHTFSKSEIYKLVNFYNKPIYNEIKLKVIFMMMFETGMRINEILTLKKEQIKDDYIIVYGKGNKERIVPKTPILAKWLKRYEREREHYFKYRLHQDHYFLSKTGKLLTNEAIAHAMKVAGKAIGISDDIRVSPHTCRHTFAQQQLENGLDLYSLMRLMGHTNISITQKYLEGIKDKQVINQALQTSVLRNLQGVKTPFFYAKNQYFHIKKH